MKTLNEIVGENLTYLRKKAGFTQLEFGEKFNYSDKTVSKWEQGDILPSVDVLKAIADFYNVSVDYLLCEHTSNNDFNSIVKKTPNFAKKSLLVALFITFIFIIGVVVYCAEIWRLGTADYQINRYWNIFLWCVPLSCIVIYISAIKIYRSVFWAMIFASAFVWSTLLSAYITFLYLDNYWFLFFIGVPLQVAIILLYNLKK